MEMYLLVKEPDNNTSILVDFKNESNENLNRLTRLESAIS